VHGTGEFDPFPLSCLPYQSFPFDGRGKGLFLFRARPIVNFGEGNNMKQEDGQPPSSGGCPFSAMEAAPVMR
jgi:hypothetical protein